MPGCLICGNLEAPSFFKPYHLCLPTYDQRCSPCREMERLETRIAGAKNALENMLEQHRELRTKMNHYHNWIILKMPPEISSSIFQFYVSESPDPYSSFRPRKSGICEPLILGAVCRSWRRIAWSSPRLWTLISIDVGLSEYPGKYDVLQECLARSGQLPLSIRFYCSEPEAIGRPLIDAINQHSSRWQSLHLRVPCSLLPLFRGDSQGDSILRRLQIISPELDWEPCEFKLKNVQPTSVSITRLPLKNVDIKWAHATHLELKCQDLQECIEAIQCSPQLTDCIFLNIYLERDQFTKPAKPIVHRNLRVLNLDFKGPYNDTGNFFDNVTLPALEDLTFCTHGSKSKLPTDILVAFVERSSCSLTTLTIMCGYIHREEDFHLLRATPLLRRLQINNIKLPLFHHFLRLLASSPSPLADTSAVKEAFLPALESFSYTSSDRVDWHLVRDIFGPLPGIHCPHRPLNNLKISFFKGVYEDLAAYVYIDKETITHFIKLREAGMTLDFRLMNNNYDRDFIQLSMDHHGMTEKKPGSSGSF